MAAHFVLTSATTAGGKVLKVKDSDAGLAMAFPVGTIATAVPGNSASDYTLRLQHPLMELDLPIASITSIAGSSTTGNNIDTDFAALIAIMP